MLVTNFSVKYTLYKLVLSAFQLFDTGRLHPTRERAIRAFYRSVDYIDQHMSQAMGFETQRELMAYALHAVKVDGHYLEFGVFTGGTISFMAKRKPNVPFHGFDSFEGLPEPWLGFMHDRATFSAGGKLPSVPGNVILHKGWFNETLPFWRQKYQGAVAFVHIDCDLYSSTVDILENLAPALQPGSVLLFDEYFNYPNWENHEFKAWQEFVTKHNVGYTYLAYARQQVALRIDRIGGK